VHRRHPTWHRQTDPRCAAGRTALLNAPPSASLVPQAGASTGAPGEPWAATTSVSPRALAVPDHLPAPRALRPTETYAASRGVTNSQSIPKGRSARIPDSWSAVTLDFSQGASVMTTLSLAGGSGRRAGLAFDGPSPYVDTDRHTSSGRGKHGVLYGSVAAIEMSPSRGSASTSLRRPVSLARPATRIASAPGQRLHRPLRRSRRRVAKSCHLPPPGGGGVFPNRACSATAKQSVTCGASGAFIAIVATGDTACTDAAFGDPVGGESKACFTATVDPPPPPPRSE
jgi:hypothetical protein